MTDAFNELAIEVWSNGAQLGYCHTATNQTALGTAGDRSLNKWLITIDGTAPHNCRIYKNGVELATRVSTYATRNFSPSGANLTGSVFSLPPAVSRPSNFLGRSNFVADNDFEGSIRYIRLYDQSLTPAQATQNTSSTVTFFPNGGTGTMASQSRTSSGTLTLNTFARPGFSFSGWNTDQNGNGTPYIDGATYSFASNLMLYAQWTQSSTTTVASTTTAANVVPTTTAPTVGSVIENDATTSDDTLPVSGLRPESLLGWVAVLVMLGIGLLLSPARRRLD
jgi:uncharacterized repeat protein (TIGR02543 family)